MIVIYNGPGYGPASFTDSPDTSNYIYNLRDGRPRKHTNTCNFFSSSSSPIPPIMGHRSGLAASDATYHSFNDIELYEPASPPRKTAVSSAREITTNNNTSSGDHGPYNHPAAVHMKRQDSGYESYAGTPRSSTSQSRPSPPLRRPTSVSTKSATPSSRGRTRPSTRRSTKSYHHHHSSSSVHIVRPPAAVEPSSYFHFPPPDPHHDHPNMMDLDPAAEDVSLQTLPPQTTHYWTSDRTRRLEYAAIDAASRGLKGWVRRHLLPDCLAARDGNRHIPFDDDTGSVRRYRLELEDDDNNNGHQRAAKEDEKAARKRMTWNFWTSGR